RPGVECERGKPAADAVHHIRSAARHECTARGRVGEPGYHRPTVSEYSDPFAVLPAGAHGSGARAPCAPGRSAIERARSDAGAADLAAGRDYARGWDRNVCGRLVAGRTDGPTSGRDH